MRYCSEKCAEEDWKWHKDFCRKKQLKKEKKEKKSRKEKEEKCAGEEETREKEKECSAMMATLKLK